MNDKTFAGYIFNRVNLIGGLAGFGIIIFTFIKTDKSSLSIYLLLTLVILFLGIALNKMFKDLKVMQDAIQTLGSENTTLNNKYEKLEIRFENQSDEYQKNIKELEKHKNVTHVVETLINANPPENDEVAKLINLLKFSVENKLKDGE